MNVVKLFPGSESGPGLRQTPLLEVLSRELKLPLPIFHRITNRAAMRYRQQSAGSFAGFNFVGAVMTLRTQTVAHQSHANIRALMLRVTARACDVLSIVLVVDRRPERRRRMTRDAIVFHATGHAVAIRARVRVWVIGNRAFGNRWRSVRG